MKSQKLIGEYIKSLREENELTQTQFAKEIQVEPQTVSKWETGNGYPDIAMFEKLALYFRITVDDLLECRNNPNRNTLFMRKEKFIMNSNKMYKLLTSFGSKEIFKSYENTLWKYDEENMEFLDSETNFKYKKNLFKDYIVAQFLWGEDERLLKFLIKNFKEKHSKELLAYMNSQNYLHKYFVSFIGPMKDFYPRDAAQFPLLNDVPFELHPQINEIREMYIQKNKREFFEETNIKKVLEKVPYKFSYNFEQIKQYYPLNRHGYNGPRKNRQGINRNYVYKYRDQNNYRNNFPREMYLDPKFEERFNNLSITDAWKSIDYIMDNLDVPELRKKLLYYIERLLLTGEHLDEIINSINIYNKYWKIYQKDLVSILFLSKNIEYITVFIDKYGYIPKDVDLFNQYAQHKELVNKEIIKQLMEKIQKLEFMVTSLDEKLEAAIHNDKFSQVDYDD